MKNTANCFGTAFQAIFLNTSVLILRGKENKDENIGNKSGKISMNYKKQSIRNKNGFNNISDKLSQKVSKMETLNHIFLMENYQN
jgi:hypothetical protein